MLQRTNVAETLDYIEMTKVAKAPRSDRTKWAVAHRNPDTMNAVALYISKTGGKRPLGKAPLPPRGAKKL